MKTINTESLTIGELAKLTDVHVETIRYYQRRDLLEEPERAGGKIRRYGEADLARIKFIKSAQKLGFSLDEIAALLLLEDGTQCSAARKIAQEKLTEIHVKLAELLTMEKSLSKLLHECENKQDEMCCPIISSLQSD
jgi:MerR family mercuric resistance operon transcriptional regulator